MGCTSCTSKGGCTARKGDEAALLTHLLSTLYPSRRWGEPDDEAGFRAGVGEREARRLARQACQALRAPTFFRRGDEGESCDYIYVLCVGRRPALLEVRDRSEISVPDGDSIDERYLRVALSSMARVSAVQEVIFELRRATDGGYVVDEKPRDGVYDPVLLRRTQSLIELLVANDITYFDFGMLVKPASRYVEDFADGDYEERYGVRPSTVNYLFYPQPPTVVTTSWIAPCGA